MAKVALATALATATITGIDASPASAATERPTCAAGAVSYLPWFDELHVAFRPCTPQKAGFEPTGYRVTISGAASATNEVPAGPAYTTLFTDFEGVRGATLARITITPFNEHGDSTALPTIDGAVLPWGDAMVFASATDELLSARDASYEELRTRADAVVRGEVAVEDLLVALREFRIGRVVEPVARLYQAYFLRLPDPGASGTGPARSRGGPR